MKITKINTVYNLIKTSYAAGVSASNTAKLVKHTTDDWEPSEVLDYVSFVSIEAKNWWGEKEHKFVKRVLASLENLYQNQ
tara:strand:- start:228 stop:467 length:240 start_codon:yes stop_codon:yes gene_type:complete